MFKITQLEMGGDVIETRILSNFYFPVASSEAALKSYIMVAQYPLKEIPVLLLLFQSDNLHYINCQFKTMLLLFISS